MSQPRVLFYVQHLLGIGHIKRASLLVQAWLEAGLDVTVVSGGEPVAQFNFTGAELVQLTPVKAADASFSSLVDSRGAALDETFKRQRRQQLLATLDRVRPDLLVIENYPFGRRQLRWELQPLLQAADDLRPRPLILSSIRDVLQARQPKRQLETLALLERYFDHVLVHGDPSFISLLDSFPEAGRIADKLLYTGYVADQPPVDDSVDAGEAPVGRDEVIVSAGGGAVGLRLMEAALAAKPRSRLAQLHWRFLLGPNLDNEARRRLQALAGPGCVLEPLRRDFPQLLANCRLSISQAGYNTVMDILRAGCPALLVPFQGSGETEQITRTRRLAELGRCAMLTEAELTAAEGDATPLLGAIDRALGQSTADRPAVTPPSVDLDGARASARLLRSLWQRHRQSQHPQSQHPQSQKQPQQLEKQCLEPGAAHRADGSSADE